MAAEHLELASRPPLTVEEFEALAEKEGWDEDTRVELLDGEVVWMSPINDPHAACVKRLNRLLNRRYPADQVLVSVQDPIRIERYDEPQPDVALLRPRSDFYATATARPADILLPGLFTLVKGQGQGNAFVVRVPRVTAAKRCHPLSHVHDRPAVQVRFSRPQHFVRHRCHVTSPEQKVAQDLLQWFTL